MDCKRIASGRSAEKTGPGMRQIRKYGISTVLGAVLGLWSAAASAQGVVRGNYNDWELRCEQVQGRDEQCILYQNVADEKDASINIVAVVLRIAEPPAAGGAATRKLVLRVIAPLGVLLPRGLGLRIESSTEKGADGKPVVKDIGSTGFVKCVPSGCVAEVEIDDKLHNELKNGSLATFIIFDKPNEGRGLPLSLNGYDRGLQALK
jgi:invasion protein IalB